MNDVVALPHLFFAQGADALRDGPEALAVMRSAATRETPREQKGLVFLEVDSEPDFLAVLAVRRTAVRLGLAQVLLVVALAFAKRTKKGATFEA